MYIYISQIAAEFTVYNTYKTYSTLSKRCTCAFGESGYIIRIERHHFCLLDPVISEFEQRPRSAKSRSCSVLQCVAVCCSVLQCVAVCCSERHYFCLLDPVISEFSERDVPEVGPAVCCSVLQCVAVCCSVLQCVAVCCSVLQ